MQNTLKESEITVGYFTVKKLRSFQIKIMLVSNGAMVMTIIILIIAILQLLYAWAMKKRAVLK